MKVRKPSKPLLIFVFALLVIVILIACVKFASCSQTLDFCATFYYVCHEKPYTESAASSMSSAVQNYGGAGYVIESGGDYFVTVSCYYEERDAQSVCTTLKRKGLSCTVVKVKVDGISLNGNAKKNSQKYTGNLKTLLSISEVCYSLANSIDYGKVDQNGAKEVLSQVSISLKGLLRENSVNCFSSELNRLVSECEDASYGYVYARDVRKLQIAICDTIANVKLY